MTNAPAPTSAFTGQIIGQAEKATRALLDALLNETATSFHQWVLMRLLATTHPALDKAGLVAAMTTGLKIGPEPVLDALDEVVALGLVTESDAVVALTLDGKGRYERIASGVVSISARLYDDLPAEDLETARRVLSLVTERANAALSPA
jgi:hypothetical protein